MNSEIQKRCSCCRRYEDEIKKVSQEYSIFPFEGVCLCTECHGMFWYWHSLTGQKREEKDVIKFLQDIRQGDWSPPVGIYEDLVRMARGTN